MATARLGFVVNPVAGMGGPIGLKGTDGWSLPELERQGAVARSGSRAAEALDRLAGLASVEILTVAGSMGQSAVEAVGLTASVVWRPAGPETTSGDTVSAARIMAAAGCRLLLFAGGDGTARDVYRAIGQAIPAFGIPSGVKMQSAAFGMSPVVAGDVAAAFLSGSIWATRLAEVVDLDEDAYRDGRIQVRLYGYLSVPDEPDSIQGTKVRSTGDEEAIIGIGRTVAAGMEDGTRYVVGPGTTAKAALRVLGLPFALLGVDMVADGRIVGTDMSAAELLVQTASGVTRLVASPIGGQGHLFGRGNQQLSAELIRRVGKGGLIVVASPRKLASLGGRPLFIDTGDHELDREMAGYLRVITGWHREVVYGAAC